MAKILSSVILVFLLISSLYGCSPIIVGTAGGAGSTSVWANGKLSQAFEASLSQIKTATETALETLELPIVKTTVKKDYVQLISVYKNAKKIWIDIEKIENDIFAKVEIRVGIIPDREASSVILKEINDNIM